MHPTRLLLLSAVLLSSATAAPAGQPPAAPGQTMAESATDLRRVTAQLAEFHLRPTSIDTRELETIGNRHEEAWRGTFDALPDVKTLDSLVAKLDANGAWTDIDYQDTDRGSWKLFIHPMRLLYLTRAYRTAGHPFYGKTEISAAIHRAFGFWMRGDPKCPNWWYNEIGVPRLLSPVGLLLGDELRSDERNYLLGTLMPRSKIGMTGQNRVWLAGNTLMFAALNNDGALVASAAKVIFSEICIATPKEGIQADFSFHQHGPQQQFGNYGLAFAVDMVKWGTILRGTPWALSPEQLAIIRHYLLDGEAWTVYHGTMDIGACGRQLESEAPAKKGLALMRVMAQMAYVDPAHAGEYQAFIERNLNPELTPPLDGNRFFWRSDYLIHRRAGFFAALKMSSNRVIGAETCNNENLSGYHLGDGMLLVQRSGDAYRDIQPVWNWRRLPGTTCLQTPGPLPPPKKSRVKSDFVGGLSDGSNGCAALDYRRPGIAAKKSWFFVNRQVACLNAGITATAEDPVFTSVEQRLANGGTAKLYADGKPAEFAGGQQLLDGTDWVEFGGLRYLFPGKQKITLSLAGQTGSWRTSYNKSGIPREPVTATVFALGFDHGKQPQNAACAYIITPTDSASQPPLEILANTPALQAVATADRQLVQAVFWQPGELALPGGQSLRSSHPCLVMWKAGTLMVSDPTQKLQQLTLRLGTAETVVALPGGQDAGRAVTVTSGAPRSALEFGTGRQ